MVIDYNKDMNKSYCVYCHTLKTDGRKYIGITKQKPYARWQRDGMGYLNGKKTSHFSNAIKKYGWDNFSHEILFDGLTKEEAIDKEIELIAMYKTTNRKYGFNSTSGGDGQFEFNAETRKKMSEKKKGLSPPNKGKPVSEEMRKKLRELSNSRKIPCYCIETGEVFDCFKTAKIKYGISHGSLKNGIYKANGWHWCRYDDFVKGKIDISILKPTFKRYGEIYQLEIGTYKIINKFSSPAEAKEYLGVNGNRITTSLHNGNNIAYGFHWCLVEDYDKFIKKDHNSRCYRKVEQYDLDGNYLATYKSLAEAGRAVSSLKRANSTIYEACIGKCKTAFGYKWKYIKETA